MLKRVFVLVVLIIMLISFTACGAAGTGTQAVPETYAAFFPADPSGRTVDIEKLAEAFGSYEIRNDLIGGKKHVSGDSVKTLGDAFAQLYLEDTVPAHTGACGYHWALDFTDPTDETLAQDARVSLVIDSVQISVYISEGERSVFFALYVPPEAKLATLDTAISSIWEDAGSVEYFVGASPGSGAG